MAILGVEASAVDAALEAVRTYADMETFGAGVLPIPDAPSGR
jgi:isoaspartyl peptidase/L-asparaginase-like protein (Ntn-hydrolase superfamily)